MAPAVIAHLKATYMSLELWIALVLATSVITLMPGPCVLLLIGQALTRSVSAAFASISGILLGDIMLVLLSLLGLGALLGTSEMLFGIVKWAGVLYMAWLGWSQIREARRARSSDPDMPVPGRMWESFQAGFLSAALNPKGIMFYLAFLPQFMTTSGNATLQILIILVTSTAVVGIILAGYVMLAARVRSAFQTLRARKRIGYVSGGCLMGGSALMAMTR
ncbi:MAG: LysE family translocator [Cohaesibacteraceae bacterium]|nr:LysE family translocator [Cohaesibacteraceae bacterium]MBL4876312.1 LysE family translocator [Cohaesibacteraceae bacterium]